MIGIINQHRAADHWRRGIDQLQAVAAAEFDQTVIDRRGRAVIGQAGRGRASAIVITGPGIADAGVVEDGGGVIAGISEIECAPVAGGRFGGSAILLGIAAGTGFFAGQGSRESSASADMVAESRPAVASPWARYQFEGNGRLAVIPRPQTKKS